MKIVRYNPDGNIDTIFGAGGVVETNFAQYFGDGAQAIIIQPDTKILIAGDANLVENQTQFTDLLLERFTGEGRNDFDAPQVTSVAFDREQAQHKLRFTFSEDVSLSIDRADLHLVNLDSSVVFSSAGIAVSYDHATNSATFTFPGALNGTLPEAHWQASLYRSGVIDDEGNLLALTPPFNFRFLRGDANGNGVINFDDYARIDNGFNNQLIGFSNGDFNYDGVVDFDDYAIIDFAFNHQP